VAKNPSRIGQARRDLARAKTILAERDGSPAVARAPVHRPEPTAARAVAEPAEAPAVKRRKTGGRAPTTTARTRSKTGSKTKTKSKSGKRG
jgi:Ribosomal L29 protein